MYIRISILISLEFYGYSFWYPWVSMDIHFDILGFLWISILISLDFYGYPFWYPWISMDIYLDILWFLWISMHWLAMDFQSRVSTTLECIEIGFWRIFQCLVILLQVEVAVLPPRNPWRKSRCLRGARGARPSAALPASALTRIRAGTPPGAGGAMPGSPTMSAASAGVCFLAVSGSSKSEHSSRIKTHWLKVSMQCPWWYPCRKIHSLKSTQIDIHAWHRHMDIHFELMYIAWTLQPGAHPMITGRDFVPATQLARG